MISKELKDVMVNLRLPGAVPTLSEQITYANQKKLLT